MKSFRVAWILLGILIISAFLFVFNKGESKAWPSIGNSRGSGLAAFSELLIADGYRVKADRSPAPKLDPKDLAIIPFFGRNELTPMEIISQAQRGAESPLDRRLNSHLKEGGKVLFIQFPRAFPYTSDPISRTVDYKMSRGGTETKRASYSPANVNVPFYEQDGIGEDEKETEEAPAKSSKVIEATKLLAAGGGLNLWTSDEGSISQAVSVESGLAIWVSGGQIYSNRFLDQNDNAFIALDHVRRLAPAGTRAVFLESAFGNASEHSLFTIFGDWAVAGRNQLILLVAVVIFSLGRRFGSPFVEKATFRGSRDMIDAVAEALRAGRHRRKALKTLAAEAEQKVRKLTKSAPELEQRDLLAKLPPTLANALVAVQDLAASTSEVPTKDALKATLDLEKAIRALERDSRVTKARP